MTNLPQHLHLHHRLGLPEDQRFLLATHPRDRWHAVAHLAGAASAWLHFHAGFRRGGEALSDLIETVRKGDLPAPLFKARFASASSAFLSGLEGHHGIEDGHYFPMFRKAEPRLQHGFEILDSDHAAIHAALRSFADCTGAVLRGIDPKADALNSESQFACESLAADLAQFRRHLLRHLDDEEEVVVPLMIALSGVAAGAT